MRFAVRVAPPHAKLASGRWSDATRQAFHPQGSNERFQICFLHLFPLPKLLGAIDETEAELGQPTGRVVTGLLLGRQQQCREAGFRRRWTAYKKEPPDKSGGCAAITSALPPLPEPVLNGVHYSWVMRLGAYPGRHR